MVLLTAAAALVVVLWVVSEFRSPRRVRLGLGVAAILSSIAVALVVGFLQRTELADRYRGANNNLAYAIETAINNGQSDRVVAVLTTLRGHGGFDLGTPADYYQDIQFAADQITPPNDRRR
jgi:hypothetical protein